jgi:BASS family bile acid:Na+ symporter
MSVEQFTSLLITLTLIEMMGATGLGVSFGDLLTVAKNWRLVGRAALANYVCVPGATVGLLFLFDAHPMVAAGFLVLAVCPGAPYGPPFTAIARGNVPVAVGLMVILSGSSALLAPIFLSSLLPMLAGDESLAVDAYQILVTLLMTQLAPLGVGVAVRTWCPTVADWLQKPADLLSKLLNLAVVGMVLLTQFDLLAEIRFSGFLGMLVLLVVSWGAGWVLGGSDSTSRRAMTLTTSLRNVGVGLIIAAGAFAGTPAVTAVMAYGLLGVVGSLLLALFWKRTGAIVHTASRPDPHLISVHLSVAEGELWGRRLP